jgi:hypothetical protein
MPIPILALYGITGDSDGNYSLMDKGIYRRNGYSAGNYQLMDEEST